ncbi:hypothetical protein [Sphingobacterium sp. JB170]|uniref:hypothetical protein n=1 Tax=Sphingobacterium sp. JB170 TaxID=1434842 RepID=UPI000B34C31C|nr:hypothetical protein [Sphingobacterium sp. JB170]
MKMTTLALCVALFLYSCNNKSKVTDQTKVEQEEPYFNPDFDYVQQTPDSLWTEEQKELAEKLTKVITENVKALDNKMVFTLTQEEFVALGIPVEYYELIQKDMVNNNKFLKENNVNVDSMMKESHKK